MSLSERGRADTKGTAQNGAEQCAAHIQNKVLCRCPGALGKELHQHTGQGGELGGELPPPQTHTLIHAQWSPLHS